jgi:hypothetical protein
MKRDATKVIWRTVVFAGAMLGAPACSKKHPQTTPANTAKPTEPAATPASATEQKTDTPDPCAGDPCAGRVRGADDDGGGGAGRGFVLS